MKLLVFDIDGTLTKTNEIDAICFSKAIEKVLGFSNIDTNWETYSYITASGIADEISKRYRARPIVEWELMRIETEFVAFIRKHAATSKNHFIAVKGAQKAIDRFRNEQGFAVALTTGGWNSSARLQLRYAGIDVEGVPLASSSDSFRREKIMEIAQKRAEELHERRLGEVVYFGDEVWDYEATRNLGWRMIGIGEEILRLEELGVPDIFADFTEMDRILEALDAQPGAPAEALKTEHR